MHLSAFLVALLTVSAVASLAFYLAGSSSHYPVGNRLECVLDVPNGSHPIENARFSCK